MSIKEKRTYVDFDLSFTRHPITNDVVKKNDADAIKQAIKIIILTSFYEKPYDPNFGTEIYDLLFENSYDIIEQRVYDMVDKAIKKYDPRVSIDDVSVNFDDGANSLNIKVAFTVFKNMKTEQANIKLEL